MKNILKIYAKKSGFTLAETLITLVVIGVIAAITVPTLITRYQKEQTVTRLQKAYSELMQTTNLAIMDNGPMKTWDVGATYNADSAKAFLKKYVTPYMKIMKEPLTRTESGKTYERKYMDDVQDNFGDYFVRFYLIDGTSITSTISTNDDTEKRIDLNIDINGDKKPNKYGRDIFVLYYFVKTPYQQYNGRFVPAGYGSRSWVTSSSNTWGCSKGKKGANCLALIMYDSWRITSEYPW